MEDVRTAAITPGMTVRARGERWRVMATLPHQDCTALRLSGEGRTNPGARLTLLQPFDRIADVAVHNRVEFVTRDRWWRTIRHLIARQRSVGDLSVLATAAIDILPYQLEPALAILRHGHLRVLIADAVGLGKTIQAAVLLAQLASEEPDFRALIVCPAALRGQWRDELRSRFGLPTTICDVDWLLDAARELPPAVNPWALPGIHIVSIDLVKQPEVLRALENVTWDTAIFDEAHWLSPGTARRAAAHALAGRSRRVVLLSATPPDGDPAHMASLIAVGQVPGGDEITVFRRTRAEMGVGSSRRSLLLPVRLTLAESRMHRLLEHYTAQLWHTARARADARARLLTILLRKRALSTARALALTIQRRLVLLGSEPPQEAQLPLPLSDEDPLDDNPSDAVVGATGLNDQADERRMLEEIRRAADLAARDESKVRALARLLARANESAIVFTEYRDTLAGLAAALSDREPLQLHGEMPVHERDQALAAFATRGGLLLATDAASEGLNLHHQCRLVIHVELPWNPMRLEQRIGRVDRLGQTRRVHEVLLVARDTAERLVLAPLVGRLRAMQRARGTSPVAPVTESEVTAMILDGSDAPAPAPLAQEPLRSLDLRAEALHEARRLVSVRNEVNAPGCDRVTAVVVHGKCRHATRCATILMRIAGDRRGGSGIGSILLPVRVELDVPSSAGDISSRMAEALVSKPGVLLLARVLFDQLHRTSAPWMWGRLVADALVQRETEIGLAVASPSQQLVQAGLFDRRAQIAADAHRRSGTVLQVDSTARLARLLTQTSLQERTEVVAIHFGDVRA